MLPRQIIGKTRRNWLFEIFVNPLTTKDVYIRSFQEKIPIFKMADFKAFMTGLRHNKRFRWIQHRKISKLGAKSCRRRHFDFVEMPPRD